MNNFLNITDNNNNSFTVSAETGEVIENPAENESIGLQANRADNDSQSEFQKTIPETREKSEQSQNQQSEPQSKAKPLYFNPRSFKPNKDCPKTAAERSFISNPFGSGLTEAYTIGNWNWDWSQIDTADMTLEKNTDYEFIFWLNGGENDAGNETCRLEIIFDNDYENRYSYNLNRGFIRYEKHFKGWYLYRIPFNTGNACCTKLCFISLRAYTTVIKADDIESYNKLPCDLPPEGIPQRHNIIFSKGFPMNSWWSYKVFPDTPNPNSSFDRGNQNSTCGIDLNALGIDVDEIMENIRERIEGELDIDDLTDEIIDNLDIDSESIKDRIIRQIKDSI